MITLCQLIGCLFCELSKPFLFSLSLYSAKVSFPIGYLLKESTCVLTGFSLFIIVSFICILDIIGKDADAKKGGMHGTPPFLPGPSGSWQMDYQEAWNPARAPTSPESNPTPRPPVNTVLSLTRRPTEAEPALGFSKVVRMRTVVLLPAPFGPRKPNTSPAVTSRLTPSTARTSSSPLPKVRTRSWAMMGDCVDEVTGIRLRRH